MAEKRVGVRIVAEGGRAVRAELQGVGAAGEAAFEGMNRAQNAAAQGAGRFRGQVQNVAFQVQDFAVQVGAGTSATQALAQQLPQLLSGFGLLGAAIGTAAAIGIPLGRAFFQTSEKAIDVDQAVSGVTSALSSYKDAAILSAATTADLQEKFGSLADEIRGSSEYLTQVKLGLAIDEVNKAIDPLQAGFETVTSSMERAAATADAFFAAAGSPLVGLDELQTLVSTADLFGQAASEAAAELGLLPDQVMQIAAAIQDLGAATGVEEIGEKAAYALSLIERFAPAGADLVPELGIAADKLGEIVQSAGLAVGSIESATVAAEGLGSGLSGAAGAAGGLLGNLQAVASAAWDAAAAMAAQANPYRPANLAVGDDGRGSQREGIAEIRALRDQQNRAAAMARSAAYMRPPAVSGGGSPGAGGGPGASAMSEPAYWDELIQNVKAGEKAFADYNNTVENGARAAADFFTSIVDGSKSAKDAVSELLAQIGKVALQQGFAQLGQSSGLVGSIFGALDNALSFDGGGYTGNGARAGGLDGKGGFLAMMHPRETVVDHTRGGGGGVVYNIDARGAGPDVDAKITSALRAYDREKFNNARMTSGDRRRVS